MSRRSSACLALGAAKKKQSRGKLRHIRDAGTRQQKDSRLYNLKLDIHSLKQELQDLVLRRELLHTRSLYSSAASLNSILRTVGQYFHMFERGYGRMYEQHAQYAFLQAMCDGSFSLGMTGFGVDMLHEQWRRYTDIFHIRDTVVRSTDVITYSAGALVKCGVEFRGVMTRWAVDTVFPNAHREPMLLLRILGREVRIPMLFHLHFNATGRLIRHDAEADFLAAVSEALDGDASAAARFIEDAHIGQESMLGPLPHSVWSHSSASSASIVVDSEGEEDRVNEYVDIIDDEERCTTTLLPSMPSHNSHKLACIVENDSTEVEEGFGGSGGRHSLAFLLAPV